MKFNKQILKEYGLQGMKNSELIDVLKYKIKWLLLHNRNYTNAQFHELQDIAELIEALE